MSRPLPIEKRHYKGLWPKLLHFEPELKARAEIVAKALHKTIKGYFQWAIQEDVKRRIKKLDQGPAKPESSQES